MLSTILHDQDEETLRNTKIHEERVDEKIRTPCEKCMIKFSPISVGFSPILDKSNSKTIFLDTTDSGVKIDSKTNRSDEIFDLLV